MNEELFNTLEKYFLLKDYKWKFDYGLANPDQSDIKAVVEKSIQILTDDDSVNAQIEIGRLIIKKEDTKFDVYVYMGTIGEEE